ncbi:nuclear transport factor 2 family protein [Janthinobacterium aquaticum]|uniref:nuclear transport factor 2 family protein n=1 Tax=Janthinobacterium sp. FT58W TaxID=2654254 RepID=UPI001265517A|nr:nuclear transport factor 2 family protein [Janthinobacterium sp. FT58W]KAB8038532.1 nuclear transport factor 2 family protein [Janthinobacterium sp. FT58W]
MHTLTLPEPISTYFASEHDSEALKQCFKDDAILKDDGHTYEGIDTITAFLAAASVKYNATTVPFDMKNNDGFHVVMAKVTGNFPGSPANLSYRFGLDHGLIESLEINV